MIQPISSGSGGKALLVLAILEACEEEGEDLPFSTILKGLRGLGPFPGAFLDELEAKYGDMPPRVAISMMLKDPSWRDAVLEASRAYLRELLEG